MTKKDSARLQQVIADDHQRRKMYRVLLEEAGIPVTPVTVSHAFKLDRRVAHGRA